MEEDGSARRHTQHSREDFGEFYMAKIMKNIKKKHVAKAYIYNM